MHITQPYQTVSTSSVIHSHDQYDKVAHKEGSIIKFNSIGLRVYVYLTFTDKFRSYDG